MGKFSIDLKKEIYFSSKKDYNIEYSLNTKALISSKSSGLSNISDEEIIIDSKELDLSR